MIPSLKTLPGINRPRCASPIVLHSRQMARRISCPHIHDLASGIHFVTGLLVSQEKSTVIMKSEEHVHLELHIHPLVLSVSETSQR